MLELSLIEIDVDDYYWLSCYLTDDTDFKTPKTGVVFGEVTVKYTKKGDSSLTTKSITTNDWDEIGEGIYKIKFMKIELNTLGDFIYNVSVADALKYPGMIQIVAFKVDDIVGGGFDTGTDTLELIRDAITSFSSTIHGANSGSITVGTGIAGSFDTTLILDEDYWQIQCLAGDNEEALDIELVFNIGEGRAPVDIIIHGRINSANNRDVDVWVWNYNLAQWDKLSSPGNQMRNSNNDKSYLFILNFEHHNHELIDHGDIKIKFTGEGTGFTTGHNLYLDQVVIGSVVEGTIQPNVIAHAVWNHDIGHDVSPSVGWKLNQVKEKTDALPDNPASEENIDANETKIDIVNSNVNSILADTNETQNKLPSSTIASEVNATTNKTEIINKVEEARETRETQED